MANLHTLLLMIFFLVFSFITGAKTDDLPLCPSVTTPGTTATRGCTDPAGATSAAYDCMTNQKCQQNFDAVSRCFGSNNPDVLDWNGSQTAAIHCCLCENFIFSLAKTWDVCAQCVQAMHDSLGVADSLTQPWANALHAQAIFCDRPLKDSLQAFARAFRDVAAVWDQFATFNPVPPGFVLNTCDTSSAPATVPPTSRAFSPPAANTTEMGPVTQGSTPNSTPTQSHALSSTSQLPSGTISGSSTRSTGQTPTSTPSPSVNPWTGRSSASVTVTKLFGLLLCIAGAAWVVADQWV